MMKIVMYQDTCDWKYWLRGIGFCCSTMEEEFFEKTFGLCEYFLHLTIPHNGEATKGRVKHCPYCAEEIHFKRVSYEEHKEKEKELSITLYFYSGNCCNYLTEFSVCCKEMNILNKETLNSLYDIARPRNKPVEIGRGGIYLNGSGIKACPYCGTEFKIKRTQSFEIN